MKKSHLTFRIFLLIFLTVIIEGFADLFMKKGLISTGITYIGFNEAWEFISGSASSIFIWTGMLMYLLNFILWITVLRNTELSIAYPVLSTSYVIVPLLAIIFLHEYIPFLRWVGIASIIIGVFFVSKSRPNKNKRFDLC